MLVRFAAMEGTLLRALATSYRRHSSSTLIPKPMSPPWQVDEEGFKNLFVSLPGRSEHILLYLKQSRGATIEYRFKGKDSTSRLVQAGLERASIGNAPYHLPTRRIVLPGAADVVEEGNDEEDEQPEDGGGGGELGLAGAELQVHEVQDHQDGLDAGDAHGHRRIEKAQLHGGRPHGHGGEDQQRREDEQVVGRGRDMGAVMVAVAAFGMMAALGVMYFFGVFRHDGFPIRPARR